MTRKKRAEIPMADRTVGIATIAVVQTVIANFLKRKKTEPETGGGELIIKHA